MSCARPRQSLKSPATISGASAGTSSRTMWHSRSSCCWRCASARPRCAQIACTSTVAAGQAQHAMQQAALLRPGDRHVVVLVMRRSETSTAPRCRGGPSDTRHCGRRRTAATWCRPGIRSAAPRASCRRLRACRACVPSTSCRNTTSAPTVRTASRSSGRMNLRLSAVKPLWVFTVMTLSVRVGRYAVGGDRLRERWASRRCCKGAARKDDVGARRRMPALAPNGRALLQARAPESPQHLCERRYGDSQGSQSGRRKPRLSNRHQRSNETRRFHEEAFHRSYHHRHADGLCRRRGRQGMQTRRSPIPPRAGRQSTKQPMGDTANPTQKPDGTNPASRDAVKAEARAQNRNNSQHDDAQGRGDHHHERPAQRDHAAHGQHDSRRGAARMPARPSR